MRICRALSMKYHHGVNMIALIIVSDSRSWFIVAFFVQGYLHILEVRLQKLR